MRFPLGKGIFSSSPRPDRLWAHPASYPMRTDGSFPRVKLPECEIDQSLPSSAYIKNLRSFTTTLPYAFMAHSDTFTLSLCLSQGYKRPEREAGNSSSYRVVV
jgi:hypothetical protein